MRRRLTLRGHTKGLVAVYDALLFLMVVILIAEGMFLYSATVAKEGGELSDDHWQHLTEAQLRMVEGLSLNGSRPSSPSGWSSGDQPSPLVGWSNGTDEWTRPLEGVVGDPEARTMSWLVSSLCELTAMNRDVGGVWDGQWDTEAILSMVDSYFGAANLNGTHHAWLLTFEGEVMLFGSDGVKTVDELPEDRWAATSDHSRVDLSGGVTTIIYEAELRYFMWRD